jgi:hypothetical protein
MADFCDKLCSVERDRMTAAEICIDELLTIMDRHIERGPLYNTLRMVSQHLSGILLDADGAADRRNRLIRVRRALTEAFPMTDEDLDAHVGGSR